VLALAQFTSQLCMVLELADVKKKQEVNGKNESWPIDGACILGGGSWHQLTKAQHRFLFFVLYSPHSPTLIHSKFQV